MTTELVWVKVNKKTTKSEKYTLLSRENIKPNTEFNLYNPLDTYLIDNLSYLKFINEPSILNILKMRYQQDKIYTLNSKILISINPFKQIKSLYNLDTYVYDENVPHIYQMAELSYKNLIESKINQSILVSGESGAGKTENTKYILKYFSNKYATTDILAQQIIDCNHIIEMLGNSMTRRNNNSSRFGKFIKIYFEDSKIVGAHIENYLLEKSRVTHYNIMEKSYHIFYALSNPILNKYNFNSSYHLHEKSNNTVIKEFGDIERFIAYLYKFNFTDFEIDNLFYTVKLVLELMNIKNYENVEDEITNISNTINKLELSEKDIILNITKKVFNTKEGIIYKDLTETQIKVRIKSFCENIYSKLFNSVIAKINEQLNLHSKLSKNDTKGLNYIGILDIFGFEIFKENGFEQLCINYTNEVLQNIYNDNILEYEQREYIKDGIDWDFIEYQSNENIIKFFNKRLLPAINEQSILETGTDKILYGKIIKLQNDILFIDDKTKHKNRFTINHYAGEVQYDVVDYILKNKIKGVGRKVKTNIHIFKKKLDELKKQLKKNKCWFIRCIKPNNTCKSNDWDDHKIYEQLIYSGIIEGIRLVLQGFPIKILLNELNHEFRFLQYYNTDIVGYIVNYKSYEDKFRVGNTKLFLKRVIYTDLLNKDDNCKYRLVTRIQSYIRLLIQRRQYLQIRTNCIRIQSNVRRFILKLHLMRLKRDNAAILLSSVFRSYIHKTAFQRMKKMVNRIQFKFRQYLIYQEYKVSREIHYKKIKVVAFIKAYATKRMLKLERLNSIIYCWYKRRILKRRLKERTGIIFLKKQNEEIFKKLELQQKKQIDKEQMLLNEIYTLKQQNKEKENSIIINQEEEIIRLQTIIDNMEVYEIEDQSYTDNNYKIGTYTNCMETIYFDTPSNDSDICFIDNDDNKIINEMGHKMEQLYLIMNRKEDLIKKLLEEKENQRRCSIM